MECGIPHYGPRPGFPYYYLTSPKRGLPIRYLWFALGQVSGSSPGDRSGTLGVGFIPRIYMVDGLSTGFACLVCFVFDMSNSSYFIWIMVFPCFGINAADKLFLLETGEKHNQISRICTLFVNHKSLCAMCL